MTAFSVGIGDTTSLASSTESTLLTALRAADANGARTRLFGCEPLSALPNYPIKACNGADVACDMVATARTADGLIISTRRSDEDQRVGGPRLADAR
ncbi:hypothetical protein U1839_00850 [Sphingomonas sp. RT2P30]|uniref:hypothetical protein n=1 Tax=Parasphingomonas halimpatiens TaxID=3096162 RepID=UPI002FC66115